MEDLDALLADLQHTTAHLKSPGMSTAADKYSSTPIYQNQQIIQEMTTTTTTTRGGGPPAMRSISPSRPPATPVRSSSPHVRTNNLSELDTLLEDLNSARFLSGGRAGAVANGTSSPPPWQRSHSPMGDRPSVESLLDDLQSAVPPSSSTLPHYKPAVRETITTVSYTVPSQHPATTAKPPMASSATKELDDLMASLSDFKMNDTATYAKPHTQPPQMASSQLDSMLGSLQSDMNKQGVSTTAKGHCAACNKPIVGQVVTAMGKTWHSEHFTCHHCGTELSTRTFFERDGKPYCETDYHNIFSPRCAYCNGPILDKCVTALDTTWHPEHFFCAQCGHQFGEEGFHERDGKPYCRNDFLEMFAPKCGGCNRPITENYISALNSQWHPDCFVCRDCRQPFNGGSFYDHEGQPYCETHYHAKRGSLCAGCHKPITGRCVTAMFRKFHPEHFVCSFCLKQLNKGTFKEQNDKPYCHACFDKLYG